MGSISFLRKQNKISNISTLKKNAQRDPPLYKEDVPWTRLDSPCKQVPRGRITKPSIQRSCQSVLVCLGAILGYLKAGLRDVGLSWAYVGLTWGYLEIILASRAHEQNHNISATVFPEPVPRAPAMQVSRGRPRKPLRNRTNGIFWPTWPILGRENWKT